MTSYLLTPPGDCEFIEQAFDHLDWRLRRGECELVQQSCHNIILSAESPATSRSWAHLLLGVIELGRGAHTEALCHFEQATELPLQLRHRAVAGAAKAKYMAGRDAEALLELQELVKLAPTSFFAWETLGSCLVALGREEEGWQALIQALRISPGEQTVLSTLVDIAFRTNRHEQLCAPLANYIAMEPMALSFRFYLASCRLLLGDVVYARDEMRRIVAFAPFSVVDPEVVARARELLEQFGEGE